MAPYQYVPSEIKTYLSNLLAVDVIVGAVEPGHFTVAGQVTVLEPDESCFYKIVKDFPIATVGNVNVQFAVSVII